MENDLVERINKARSIANAGDNKSTIAVLDQVLKDAPTSKSRFRAKDIACYCAAPKRKVQFPKVIKCVN